jgi:SAM-dependent methyltransferase
VPNIENALKVEGWMRPAELQWLAEQASTRKVICEVGSWMGRSTRALADNLPDDGILFAVDTWLGSEEIRHKETLANKPLSPYAEKPGDNWLMDKFRSAFPEDYFAGPRYRVRPYQNTSLAGADYLGFHYGYRFDMIFLDAAHDYDNVIADIKAWLPLLAPGGLLCGHDFGGSFPGVTRAVQELLPDAKKVGAGSIWAKPL